MALRSGLLLHLTSWSPAAAGSTAKQSTIALMHGVRLVHARPAVTSLGCCPALQQRSSCSWLAGWRPHLLQQALLPPQLQQGAPCRPVSAHSNARGTQCSEAARVAPDASGNWTAKRPLRKTPSAKAVQPATAAAENHRKLTSSKPDMYSVVAYATAEEYSLQSLANELAKQGLYKLHQLPTDVPDVLYASSTYATSAEPRELFVFREGTVVFWNVEQAEVEAFLQLVRRHELDSYDRQLVTTEQEEMDYTYHEAATRLAQDELRLRKRTVAREQEVAGSGAGLGTAAAAAAGGPGSTGEAPPPAAAEALEEDKEDSLALQKYSVANALSLSVKLSIWEASLNRYVDSIEYVTEDLKSGIKLRMSRRDVLRKTGELFALRHLINLSSDLLDTPDFYWDRERLERLYLQTCAYLNINRRTKVMNEKLSHCCDLTGLLREHLNHNHSARLEWMIIVLIMIEIIFEVIHYIDK